MQVERNEATLIQEPSDVGDAQARQRTAVVQAERSLRAQRAELVRMMAELRQLQQAVRTQQNPELEALRLENEQLHRALAEKEVVVAAPSLAAETVAATEGLRAEVALLRQLVEEKDALLKELEKRPGPAPRRDRGELEIYEAELNAFRQQLENDRRKLTEEREQLRQNQDELSDATREMEMELSRERAELARERTRVERLRDEARAEVERIQRDAGVMNRLAPVQRLREQLNEGRDS